MVEDEFSRAFKDAAPSPNAGPSIVTGARLKRRRARRAGGAVAVIGVLALATPAVLHFMPGGNDGVLATPAPTHSATLQPPTPSTPPSLASEDTGGLVSQVCADVQSGKVAPDNLPANSDLPLGAARVWLCGDLNDPFGGAVGPREPLLEDPDRVVAAINALEPLVNIGSTGLTEEQITAGEGIFCTEAGGLTFHIVVDYPDGNREVISAETVNCGWVGGWGNRSGGSQLLAEIEPFWEAQRETLPPFEGEPDLCSNFPRSWDDTGLRGPSSFRARDIQLSEITRGAVCGLRADAKSFDGEVVQTWLPEDVVARIAAGELTPSGINPGLPYLMLLTQHGDPIHFPLDADGAATPWLAEALSDVRTEPFYVRSPHCGRYTPDAPPAELSEVTTGVVCLDQFATPTLPADLDPELVARIAQGFSDGAAPPQYDYGGMTSQRVTLLDGDGNFFHLDVTVDGTGLISESAREYWELPTDLKDQLAAHGIDF